MSCCHGGHRANLLEQDSIAPVQTEPIRRIRPAILLSQRTTSLIYFVLLDPLLDLLRGGCRSFRALPEKFYVR